jgi:hypothetical protein
LSSSCPRSDILEHCTGCSSTTSNVWNQLKKAQNERSCFAISQASEQEALSDKQLRNLLAPAWRVLLLSDGSVTRHLQLLSDFGSVTADCFQMEDIGETLDGLPPGVELVPGPRVQRQVGRFLSVAAAKQAGSWSEA